MPPKRKRYRSADASLTRAENKKKSTRDKRNEELLEWTHFLRSASCDICDSRVASIGLFKEETAPRECCCPSKWNLRWVWMYDLNMEIMHTRMIFCLANAAVVVKPVPVTPGTVSLDCLLHVKDSGPFKKGDSCFVDRNLVELTLWTREMEKGTPMHTQLQDCLKRFLFEIGVCEVVFDFLRFPVFPVKLTAPTDNPF